MKTTRTQSNLLFLFLFATAMIMSPALAQKKFAFSNATIYTSRSSQAELKIVVQVLQEEIQKRSGTQWTTNGRLDRKNNPQVVIALENDKSSLPADWLLPSEKMEAPGKEGFQLITHAVMNKILILANSKRGALYGVGYLLRKLDIRRGAITADESMQVSTSPRFEIRGHQLGYRPKTNAYDAWSVAQFDAYIRDLAIFGANSIEIMPPRTDDDFTSEHMKLPAIDMIREQSRICDAYDLDVWMWYPNMGTDYTHPDSVSKELDERHEVFAAVPRLDHLFVPGGDPGDLEPGILFAWLEQEAKVLHQHHPRAKIWVSPQVFRPTKVWLDEFYHLVNKKPEWLGGVVFGPWVKTSLEEMRGIVRADIPIRRYPDITHSLSSQYPVPQWDLAYATTLGRECINPRPVDQKYIHNTLDQFANGSISYSEGSNDDVNKFVWSGQDWDPGTPVIETLRDYARYFMGPDVEEGVAQGLMALEKNLKGPLLVNDQVQITLYQWAQLEQRATPELRINYRFQMALLRAYYDSYVQQRLVYETWLEQKAREVLGRFEIDGIDKSIAGCKTILAKAQSEPVDQTSRLKCEKLADDLFQSIGAQLTIKKHGAMSGRGNFMDNIDLPLNDAAWIYSELSKAEKADTPGARASIVQDILHRNNPGPGGFYDNFGSPASWDRVVKRGDVSRDPGSLKTPRVSFGVGLKNEEWVHEVTANGFEGQAAPRAWMHQVNTLYDTPLEITYKELNPAARYVIRVAYTGRFRSKMKMMADESVVHDFIQTGEQPMYEFQIPEAAYQDGEITFSWTCGEAGRGAQVSEIWIIKK